MPSYYDPFLFGHNFPFLSLYGLQRFAAPDSHVGLMNSTSSLQQNHWIAQFQANANLASRLAVLSNRKEIASPQDSGNAVSLPLREHALVNFVEQSQHCLAYPRHSDPVDDLKSGRSNQNETDSVIDEGRYMMGPETALVCLL